MSQTLARSAFLATFTLTASPVAEASVDGRPLPFEATQVGRTQLPPQHEHDCGCCTFLGRRGLADLYVCFGDSRSGTLIARRGPDGDYSAVAVDTFRDSGYRGQPDIVEAYERYMIFP